MLLGLFGNKITKEERKTASEQAKQDYAEKEAKFQEKYNQICTEVKRRLSTAKKPEKCNVVTSRVFGAEFFEGLEDYQWNLKDWEIWRSGEQLYLYNEAVDGYPDYEKFGLYIGDPAPMLLEIAISDIQYFKIEGDIYSETKITGGKVTQNRRTGKISQTPLQAKTVNKDTRYVRVTAKKKGLVQHIDFTQDSYDVFFSLIPEKEYSRVIKG